MMSAKMSRMRSSVDSRHDSMVCKSKELSTTSIASQSCRSKGVRERADLAKKNSYMPKLWTQRSLG